MLRYGLFMALNRWAWWSARMFLELSARIPYERRWAKPRKVILRAEDRVWKLGYWSFRQSIKEVRHVA